MTQRAAFSGSEGVEAAIVPHPFSARREFRRFAPGMTLEEIVAAAQPDIVLRRHAHVWIGGHYVPRAHWARVRPRAGTRLAIRMVPMGGGGGGKNPLRTVLSLALMAVMPSVSASLTGMLKLGEATFLGRAVTFGVGLAGQLALNALAPPSRARYAGVKESPTLFIQGARNHAKPFSRVPRVLGRHRMVPPLGAEAYTETIGNDQYLRMLFVWGYGPLEVSDLKIGETPLSDFEGVEVETRQGYDDDAPLTLYSNSVLQNDLQVALTHAAGFVTRTSETEADELSVDVTFPRGLFVLSGAGAKTAATVQVEIGWSPKGEDDWTDEVFTWTAAQGAALRKAVRFTVPRGQYDVRVRRVTADSVSDSVFDEAVWTALRTVRSVYPIRMTGLAVTAVRIKATDQLSGVIDRFNGVVASILPDWGGEAWVERVTSNPASIYRHVLQGRANARPLDDSRLDLERIEEWHARCAAAGREFNAVIDYDVSVREVLRDVAAAGRASPTLVDGKWAVVEDRPQSVPVQHFTPRNTWGFSGEKAFDDLPHALRVRFINREKGWMQDEALVYDDGYDAGTATKYETLEPPGVTSPAQAWREGRYHIATARLRPEIYSFSADVEHIVCTRGDLIRFTHDVPLFGLASARVRGVEEEGGNAVAATIDCAVVMEEGKSYTARFRKADGTSLLMPLVTAAGEGSVLSFAEPCPLGEGPEAGDLVLFGESGQESVELVVRSIEPRGDLSARITCVDAAPAVHAADTGVIPEFSAQMTVPPEMRRPPAPVVASVQSGREAMIAGADGALVPSVIVTLAPVSFGLPLEAEVSLRRPEETDFRPAQCSTGGGCAVITGVETGARYDIRIVYRSIYGASSAPAVVANHLVEGMNAPPGDVAGFAVNIMGETAYLSWTALGGAELSHYRIKFNNATTGATWANSFEIVSRVSRAATSITVPAQVGTWLIKAVGSDGRESGNAAAVTSVLDRVEGYIPRLAGDETAHFGGTMDSLAGTPEGVAFATGGRLVLDGALSGVYYLEEMFDLFFSYPCLLSAEIGVAGVTAGNDVDDWGNVDLVEDWDGLADPADWETRLQLRVTEDDPLDAPVWSDWRDFVVGEHRARAFQFRLLLSSRVEGVTPSVESLSIHLAMRALTQGGAGLESGAADDMTGGGTRVDFAEEFYDLAALTVTPHDMATGDYFTILGRDAGGFNIAFFDDADARVTREFDYIAQGIGRKAS